MAVVQGSIFSSYPIEIEKTNNLPLPTHRSHFKFIRYYRNPKKPRSSNYSFTAASSLQKEAQTLVQQFNPQIPIEEALTPPSSWYTDPDFYSLELEQVFYRGWQAVGCTEQIEQPQQYFTDWEMLNMWSAGMKVGTYMHFIMFVAIMPLFLHPEVGKNLVLLAHIMLDGCDWIRLLITLSL